MASEALALLSVDLSPLSILCWSILLHRPEHQRGVLYDSRSPAVSTVSAGAP